MQDLLQVSSNLIWLAARLPDDRWDEERRSPCGKVTYGMRTGDRNMARRHMRQGDTDTMRNLICYSCSTLETVCRSVDERKYLRLNIFYFYLLHLLHKCNYDNTHTKVPCALSSIASPFGLAVMRIDKWRGNIYHIALITMRRAH